MVISFVHIYSKLGNLCIANKIIVDAITIIMKITQRETE